MIELLEGLDPETELVLSIKLPLLDPRITGEITGAAHGGVTESYSELRVTLGEVES